MSVFGENVLLSAWNKDSRFAPKSKRVHLIKIGKDANIFLINTLSISYSQISRLKNSIIPHSFPHHLILF